MWNTFWKQTGQIALIAGLLTGLFCAHTNAGLLPETATAEEKSTAASEQDIANWIKDLDSNAPETRQQAAKKLEQAGAVAVDAITKAAETRNPELSTQCLEILKSLYEGKDAKTKAKAETALKQLTTCRIPSVAKRAEEITQKPVQPRRGQRIFGGFGGPIQIRVVQQARQAQPAKPFKKVVKEDGKQIEISETPGKEIVVKITEKIDGKEQVTETKAKSIVELRKKNKAAYDYYRKHKPKVAARQPFQIAGLPQGKFARNMAIKTTIVNGKRTIEANENGKQVVITDENKKDITIKITEKVKGVEKTTEVQAKDLEELKKKNPAAAKEYEKYDKGNAGIQIRIQGLQGVQQQIIPGVLPQQKIQPRNFKQIEEIQKRVLKELQERVRKEQERIKEQQEAKE